VGYQNVYASTAHALGKGVIGHGTITGGSGGTDGTYTEIEVTGGTIVYPAYATVVVSGGAVTSITIDKSGYYTVVPTGFDLSGISGLSGASATPTTAANRAIGEYFAVESGEDDETLILYQVTSGPAATEKKRFRVNDWLGDSSKIIGARHFSFSEYKLNTTRNDNGTITFADSGDLRFNIKNINPTDYPSGVNVWVPKISGSFTSKTVAEEKDNGTNTVTAAVMTETDEGLYFSISSLNALTEQLEVRIKSNDVVCLPPIVYEPGKLPLIQTKLNADRTHQAIQNYAWTYNEKPNVRNIQSISTNPVLNAGGDVSSTGYMMTVPGGGTAGSIVIGVEGLAKVGDTVMAIVRVNESPKSNGAEMTMSSHDGIPGGAGVTGQYYYLGNNIYMVEAPADTGHSTDPSYMNLNIDHRNGVGDLTVDLLYVGVNADGPPLFLQAPVVVTDALSAAGVATAYVDNNGGSDTTGTGSIAAPFETVDAALAAGYTQIYLRKNDAPHRTSSISISSTPRASFIGYSDSGDTEKYARLWGSTEYVAADFTATSTDSNVYYMSLATDPLGVWEVSSAGVIARLGEEQTISPHGPRPLQSSSEADVRATAGSWWHGTGSEGEGVYIHPTGSSITGKTYELSNADALASFTSIARLEIEGIEFAFGRNNVLQVDRCGVVARHSRFIHSGNNDAVTITDSDWTDENAIFEDAGDDGYNVETHTRSHHKNSQFINNLGDGWAPHGSNNHGVLDGCVTSRNAKQGVVDISVANSVRLINHVSEDNYSIDIYITPNNTAYGAGDTEFTAFGVWGYINVTSETGAITGYVRNHLDGSLKLDGATVVAPQDISL